jgi:hypothetical protein
MGRESEWAQLSSAQLVDFSLLLKQQREFCAKRECDQNIHVIVYVHIEYIRIDGPSPNRMYQYYIPEALLKRYQYPYCFCYVFALEIVWWNMTNTQ